MDSSRQAPCAAPPLPAALATALDGHAWARSRVGESGCAVYRLHSRPGAPDLYLKHGQGTAADDLVDEMVRLRWLAGHIAVPEVTRFLASDHEAWLVTTALPGETAWQALMARPQDRPALVDAIADFLGRVHAIPVSACPFTSDHGHRLARARRRIDLGLVDADDFDAEREGWTAEQVWEAIQKLLPFPPDPVVTHGDFSLDNLLLVEGRVIGCIDVGRAGIADRYQDLAIMWNCLCAFGDDLAARFLARYGIATPDARRLDFHLLLDELF